MPIDVAPRKKKSRVWLLVGGNRLKIIFDRSNFIREFGLIFARFGDEIISSFDSRIPSSLTRKLNVLEFLFDYHFEKILAFI